MERALRVLIVEDSEDDVLLLLRQLRQDGYDPIYETAGTASKFKAALDKPGWDIIISDYVLPNFSGLDALKIIQEKGLDIPCIIVSGRIDEETAVASMKSGARDYVMKGNLKRLGPAIERELQEAEGRKNNRVIEEKFHESQQQLQHLFQNMYEGVVLLDVGGRVLKINAAAARMLKLDPTQVEGTYYDSPLWTGRVELEDGTVLDRDQLSVKRLLEQREEILNQEAKLQLPDGTTHWIRGSITPLLNNAHNTRGVVITFADITNEKMLQEQLTQKLLEAQEEERKRIARELHDDTAQSLSAIRMELDSLVSGRTKIPNQAIDRLKNLRTDIDRTTEDVRRYSHELHPALLDHLGLVAALEQLVTETRERAGLEINIDIQGEEKKLAENVELVLFRISQESLNNIRKHSNATKAKVSLEYWPDKVRLSVADNGKGFKVAKESQAAVMRGSLGLVGMRERAHLINADFHIESEMNCGTKVIVEVKS